MKLEELVKNLYAHTTMTADDITHIADKHGLTVRITDDDVMVLDGNGSVTFSVVTYDNGTIIIFDID